LAQKWNDIGADVILAKNFKRLVRRRNTLVSEGIDTFLPCHHAVSISGRYEFDAHKCRCDGIATRLYKPDKCVINQGGTRWDLSQITDEIEPSERGRYVLGARRKSERETRKLRCAKPSAPKPRRRRMKPTLNWSKSKAEAACPCG
jgi:hypothetical protein